MDRIELTNKLLMLLRENDFVLPENVDLYIKKSINRIPEYIRIPIIRGVKDSVFEVNFLERYMSVTTFEKEDGSSMPRNKVYFTEKTFVIEVNKLLKKTKLESLFFNNGYYYTEKVLKEAEEKINRRDFKMSSEKLKRVLRNKTGTKDDAELEFEMPYISFLITERGMIAFKRYDIYFSISIEEIEA